MTISAKLQLHDTAEFAGKRVLVTGRTKGIGAAGGRGLAWAGAAVVTTARLFPPGETPGGFIQADLSTRQGADRVIGATLELLGGVDILINSVGGSAAPAGGALALTDDPRQQALGFNLLAAVRLARGLLPAVFSPGSAAIVHGSSIQRTLPLFEATLAYAAAKAALSNYSKGLANEVSPRGIRVNSVAPGYTETESAVGLVERLAAEANTDTDTDTARAGL